MNRRSARFGRLIAAAQSWRQPQFIDGRKSQQAGDSSQLHKHEFTNRLIATTRWAFQAIARVKSTCDDQNATTTIAILPKRCITSAASDVMVVESQSTQGPSAPSQKGNRGQMEENQKFAGINPTSLDSSACMPHESNETITACSTRSTG